MNEIAKVRQALRQIVVGAACINDLAALRATEALTVLDAIEQEMEQLRRRAAWATDIANLPKHITAPIRFSDHWYQQLGEQVQRLLATYPQGQEDK